MCLLLGESLTVAENNNCQRFTGRAYNTFETGINGVSAITGANLLDIASIGIDQGLLALNVSMVLDGYSRVHGEVAFKSGLKADGIRIDGCFGRRQDSTSVPIT